MLTLTPQGNLAAYARYLHQFPDDLAQFVPALGETPVLGSIMADSLTQVAGNPPRKQALAEIRDRCLFNAAVTKEACVAVARLMVPNWKAQLVTVAAVRMALEAAGLVCWLLKPGLSAEQRVARYVASADSESKQGSAFISLAIRNASHLKDELVAVGTRSIRPTRDARDELKAGGITPTAMPEPGALAAHVADEAVYRAFSSAVHGSAAGIKEFSELLLGPKKRHGFFLLLIELTGRAHAIVAIRIHEYVRGPMSSDFRTRLDSCAVKLGTDPSRLNP